MALAKRVNVMLVTTPGHGRAVATPKTWEALAGLRRCPHRVTAIVQAILTLEAIESARCSG
ncbi:hypothetical protein [Streptosporangium longisporum]|uniref:Uncharacterized protein n=1 Tax=Streptosporangium longisporum TaxID=46187 RepID=A0ABP6KSK1_9ACTN